jgi:hypothetical protein
MNGHLDVSIEDCKSINQLKKKICKCYGLGKDIVIADAEKRVLDENLIIMVHPEDVWIYLIENGSLADVSRTKIEYEIILNGSVHNFKAVMFNAWNHRSLEYYINCLIGGEQRKVEIYLDGQIWTEKLCAMWRTRARITGMIGKCIKASTPKCSITSKEEMEIRNINVKCGSFSKYLTIWNKVTIGYALEIGSENVERFPDYDWVLYNNKRLKDSDLSEDIIQIRDYGILYLKVSIKGSGIEGWEKIVGDLKGVSIMAGIAERWIEYLNDKGESNRLYDLEGVLKFDPMIVNWWKCDDDVKEANRKVIYDNYDMV